VDSVRVNVTLEGDVWERFSALVPKRRKSGLINELIKKELDRIAHQREEETLAAAFREAASDRKRLAATRDWETLDREDWK
jgi:hypothetical protein